jgi:hypothetical protein
MKIDKKKCVIRLGRDDTKRWQNSGPDGDKFRRSVRTKAETLANQRHDKVEIYASESAGGWMADQVIPTNE